ncbi:MAG TPA: hypothetical protein VEJ18_05140 [Planctomycetota bacterium]|nr:hypothetical protein [Planctomycetota bacterium]
MRRTVLLLAGLWAGCGELPPEPSAESQVAQEAFEDWLDALIRGDAPAAWAGLSEGNRSHWIFERLRDGDSAAHDWRKAWSGETRTQLDLWYFYHRDRNDERVRVLPTEVLAHPSTVALWTRYFKESLPEVRRQMQKLEITQVYADGAMVTVLARNLVGKIEMYQLRFEAGGWKVDHHREAVRQVPR